MFSWRTKATQQQHEQVEIERVEAEARARAEEAALLNAEVAKRLRTRSGEGEAPGSDEGATLPTGGRTGRRRSSANLTVDRRGSVSTKEADLINQLVKQRSAAQVERRKTRSREQLAMEEAAKEFKRAAAAKAEGATDAADGNEESPPHIVSPPQRAIPSKWLSARDRLQAMTREFEERKLAATGGSENGQRPEDTSNSSALSPNAKNLGAARAAAKLAGGVFYSREENIEMISKLKALSKHKSALEARVAELLNDLQSAGLEPSLAKGQAKETTWEMRDSKTGVFGDILSSTSPKPVRMISVKVTGVAGPTLPLTSPLN